MISRHQSQIPHHIKNKLTHETGNKPPLVRHRVEKKPPPRPSSSTELHLDVPLSISLPQLYESSLPHSIQATGYDDTSSTREEIFHMRIGKFSFRQRWIDRQVSPSLTYAVATCIALAGFVLGVMAGRCDWSWAQQYLQFLVSFVSVMFTHLGRRIPLVAVVCPAASMSEFTSPAATLFSYTVGGGGTSHANLSSLWV